MTFVTRVCRGDSVELGSQAELSITVFGWYLLMNILYVKKYILSLILADHTQFTSVASWYLFIPLCTSAELGLFWYDE